MLPIMKEISTLLYNDIKEIRMDTKNPQYRVRTISIKGNINLINYLEKYN